VNESRPQQLKISSQDEASYLYPMSTQCKVEHPFASPWDTVTDEMLDPETIKTWISDNAHSLIAHREFIKVISQNKELHLELYNKSSLLSLHLDSTIDLSSHWPAEMNTRRPALIFFDSDTMEEDKIPLIEEFITLIKSTIDYRPIIIISRTETAGPAFQKVFNYPMILSLPQPLEFGIIANLAQTYLKRKGSNLNSLNSYAFKNSDPRRAVDVVFSPVINKLTEHSIDLYSPLEIPFYSVLHFKIPLDFYATITPSKSPTEQRGNNFYYHCLIHGVDEKQVSRLRQFVNQLIYSPIEDFSEESIKKTSEVKVVEEKPVIVKATAPDPVKIEHHNWDEARKQIKGKSKL
jgi:hypothetical protein